MIKNNCSLLQKVQSLQNFRALTQGRRANGAHMVLRTVTLGKGDVDAELVGVVREFSEIFFQTRCVLLPSMELESPAIRQLDGEVQLCALSLLSEVSIASSELDPDREVIACLALTNSDLFFENCLFVFGHAVPKLRACVCSLNRLGEEVSREQLIRRTLVTLVHECGHLIRIDHCERKLCLANASGF